MNMQANTATQTRQPDADPSTLDQFANELNEVRERTMKKVGKADAKYAH